ncbi:MAG TPA: ABC transporter permease subunit [Tissierellaceae bacterium]
MYAPATNKVLLEDNNGSQMLKSKKSDTKIYNFMKGLYHSRYLYLLIVPVIVYYFIFHYIPMYGVIIAFKDFNAFKGILGSPWAGFKHFKAFFESPFAYRLIRNTLTINIYDLVVGFPAPIILALLINEVKSNRFKRSVQTIVYMPHFISVVVVCGMLISFLSPSTGIINRFIQMLGGNPIHFLAEPRWFKTVYVLSGVWQSAGWGSIIYLAALAGIEMELYEAATVDGATKWQKLIYVTLPGILPTIIIMLILRMGRMFTVGFEKIMLLYNPLTYETADVISTYVYRKGILEANYSYTAAIGLFNSVINFIMLVTFNKFSRKVSEISLW